MNNIGCGHYNVKESSKNQDKGELLAYG